MRFYEEWNGFIWEYNSIWDYVKALIGRLIGGIIGIAILLLIMYFFYMHWRSMGVINYN